MGQPQWQLGEYRERGGVKGEGNWGCGGRGVDCSHLPLSPDPLFLLFPGKLHGEWGRGHPTPRGVQWLWGDTWRTFLTALSLPVQGPPGGGGPPGTPIMPSPGGTVAWARRGGGAR